VLLLPLVVCKLEALLSVRCQRLPRGLLEHQSSAGASAPQHQHPRLHDGQIESHGWSSGWDADTQNEVATMSARGML
jgi:hypothetical protein